MPGTYGERQGRGHVGNLLNGHENPFCGSEFDRSGDIVRLFDKRANREVLVAGQKANQWQVLKIAHRLGGLGY